MSSKLVIVMLVLGCTLLACRETPAERPAELQEAKDAPAPPPTAAVKQPEPMPAAESSETPTAAQLPVAEDFQAETAVAIVRGNYRSELDALEAELGAEAE